MAIEHVTEKVRSVAVGDTELVGQARNLGQIPIVVVDNDPSKSAEDLLLWEWLYDVEIEEEYRDSKGNRQTRRYWRTIDSDAGGSHLCCTTVPAASLLRPAPIFQEITRAAHDNMVL